MVCQVDFTLCTSTHSFGSLRDRFSYCEQNLEVQDITAWTRHTLTELEQFLARLSNDKVSGLSKHNCHDHCVQLKGPGNNDPLIRFYIQEGPYVEGGTIGFK